MPSATASAALILVRVFLDESTVKLGGRLDKWQAERLSRHPVMWCTYDAGLDASLEVELKLKRSGSQVRVLRQYKGELCSVVRLK